MEASMHGQQQQVTEQLLLSLTECKSLGEISVLSLRNKNLVTCLKVLSNCVNLIICYLQYNRISQNDMQLHLGSFKALQKIDLSFNSIKKLPDARTFQELKHLKVLYLHDNHISQWADLQNVKCVPSLVHLTLQRNPVCQIPGYRSQLVNQMKNLMALDDYIVTDEERIDYTSSIAVRFRALSNYMKILIPKFQENQSADQHLFNLEVDLYRIRRMFERNSPSIRIQSFFRGYRVRNQAFFSANDRVRAALNIQKVFRGWRQRTQNRLLLQQFLHETNQVELLFSEPQFRKYKAKNMMIRAIRRFTTRYRSEKLHQSSALKIQTFWRCRNMKHKIYRQVLGINDNPKIYFLKEQRIDLQKIFRVLLENYPIIKMNYSFEKLKSMITLSTEYMMIRYPNPLIFKRQPIPIIQFSKPTLFSKVKVDKGMSTLTRDGQSITNQYLRFSGMNYEKETLAGLNIRLYYTSNKDVGLITHSRLPVQGKKRNEYLAEQVRTNRVKKQYDNYQELMIFHTEDSQLMNILLDVIWSYNLDESNEVFMTFFPKIMDKVAAAIKIQQSFRSYRLRKFQKAQLHPKQIIYPTNECWFARALIQHRAALCISQWWKNLRLQRRLEALSSIRKFVSKIDHPTLYIEESIYMNLGLILTQQSKSLRFIEQNLKFDFKHPNDIEIAANINTNIGTTIPSQEMIIDKLRQSENPKETLDSNLSKTPLLQNYNQDHQTTQSSWHIVYSNTTLDTLRFKHYPVPTWLWDTVEDFNRYRLAENQISLFFNNFLGIIHRASFDHMPEVKDFNEIVDPKKKTMNLNLGLNFISIDCGTVSEAKKRALLVAILSYNLKRRSFIRLFTQNTLGDGMCIKTIYEVWKQYQIDDPESRMSTLVSTQVNSLSANQRQSQIEAIRVVRGLKERQKKQEHQGYVLSEQGKWESQDFGHIDFARIETKRPPKPKVITSPRNGLQKEKRKAEVTMELSFVYLQISGLKKADVYVSQSNFEDTGINWTAKYIQKLNQHHKNEIDVTSSQPISGFSNFHLGKAGVYVHPPTAPSGAIKPSKGLNPIKSNRNLQPGFYYHTSSKEPVASVKNIGNESPIKESYKSTQRYGVVIRPSERGQTTSGDRTTKAGTAWPSTRQGAGSPHQQSGFQPPQTAGSLVLFKSMNKSSHFASAIPSTAGSPTRYGTANPTSQIRKGSMVLGGHPVGVTHSQNFPGVRDSQKFSHSDLVLAGEDQNLWLMKKQREEVQESKEMQRQSLKLEHEQKKLEIAKARQVSEVMKHVLKVEQDANMRIYQKFNREEKELMRDLRDKDNEKLNMENLGIKSVVHAHMETRRKRSEDRQFANNFAQIRNLITKQTHLGEMIKHKTNALKRNKANAQNIRKDEQEFIERKNHLINGNKNQSSALLSNNPNKQAINSTLFDPCEIQEITFQQRQGVQTAAASPNARLSLGKSRKIINLKKGDSDDIQKQFETVNAAASKGSIFLSHDSKGAIKQDANTRVIDYVPNHNHAQFAEISAKMNHKRIPSQYMTNAFSQPRSGQIQPPSSAGGQSNNGGGMHVSSSQGFQPIPPGSRHMQRLTFIEEKFPLSVNINHFPLPSSQAGGQRLTRYEQL